VRIVTNSFTAAGGDNYPTFEDAFGRDRVNLGLGYEQALRIHAELPGDARPADDPGHRHPVRGPDGEGRYVAI
jgi:hypothetical protein